MKLQSVILTAAVAAIFGTACGPARPVADAGCQGILCNVSGGGTGSSTGGGSAAGGGTASNGGGTTSNGGGSGTTGGGSGTTGGGTGSTGGGSGTTGGGTGSTGGGSGNTGGGTGTIQDVTLSSLRSITYCSQKVRVTGAVVTAIDSISTDGSGNKRSSFWVADPANPTAAVYVFKDYSDLPEMYAAAVGDTLTLEGYLGTAPNFVDRTGYRQQLRSGCSTAAGTSGIPLTITVGAMVTPPTDNTAPSDFGQNSDGGSYQANRNMLGARVYIPGPLTLSNPSPGEFKRVSLVPTDTVYFGFAVSGGSLPGTVLVNNYKTFGTTSADGGSVRCDWRAMVLDGGTVTFPNGIRGIWDSYTHASCADGGTSCSFRNAGTVPGTTLTTTNVLFPLDCPTDFAGGLYTP